MNKKNKKDKWQVQEDQIIKDCQNKNIGAYKMIYDRYEQPLLHTALRFLGQQQDAEDAVQMTFIKLYKSIRNYHFGAKFSTYLFKILINTCFDLLKKRNRLKTIDIDLDSFSTDSSPDKKIYLEDAILKLPERMRVCFVLHAVEGVPQMEIANILNLTVGGVKSNVYHAKTRLRAFLSDPAAEVDS
ncbi:MAG: RNA polymerase sigma factor [Candidatus Aminicenantes bacterium]|nr:RNA polymerase sigma factor [Candidatus Aminicenantes bacterium]